MAENSGDVVKTHNGEKIAAAALADIW